MWFTGQAKVEEMGLEKDERQLKALYKVLESLGGRPPGVGSEESSFVPSPPW